MPLIPYTRLGGDRKLDEADDVELGRREQELRSDLDGKGYVPDDLDAKINSAEMLREGGAGTVSLPPTVYTAPIVLTLTASPADRRNPLSYALLLGPVWAAVGISIVLQFIFSYYMHASIVHLVTDDLVAVCGDGTSALLRYVALVTFVAMVVQDVMETYDVHAWLTVLPSADRPEEMTLLRFTEKVAPPDGKNRLVVPVSGITRFERSSFYFVCLVPKLVVAVACLVAGSGALLRSADNFNLILNAVAATFILQIDDALYALFVPDASRKMASAMPSIHVHVTVANDTTSSNEYAQRPLQLVGIGAVVGVVTFLLQAFLWCNTIQPEPSAGETANNTTESVFFDILAVVAILACAFSCRAISRSKTAQEKLFDTYVAKLRGTSSFELSDANVGETAMRAFLKALSASQVTSLKIGKSTPREAVLTLAKELQADRLVTLDLAECEMGLVGIKALTEGWAFTGVLTTLNLRQNDIGNSGATALASALRVNGVLTNLVLWDNNIGDEGAKALASALRVNGVLTSLDVGNNVLTEEAALGIVRVERQRNKLTSLGLAGNPRIAEIRDAAMLHAGQIMQNLGAPACQLPRTYQRQNLARDARFCCNIGQTGIAEIAEYVSGSAVLKTLYLNSNEIGDEGAKALASALRVNAVLTSLDVSGNKIGPTGATAIAKALRVNAVLTTLVLSDTRIGNKGAKALASALRVNEVLERIELESNNLSDKGKGAIQDAVSGREGFTLQGCDTPLSRLSRSILKTPFDQILKDAGSRIS